MEVRSGSASGLRPGSGATWEWMRQNGVWQQHNWRTSSVLERAFQQGRTTVRAPSPAGLCEVDFQKMTQRFLGGQAAGDRDWKLRRVPLSVEGSPSGSPAAGRAPSSSSRAESPQPVSSRGSRAGSPHSGGHGQGAPPRPRPTNTAGAAIVRAAQQIPGNRPPRPPRPRSTDGDEALAQMLALEEQQRILRVNSIPAVGSSDPAAVQQADGEQRRSHRHRRSGSEARRRRAHPGSAVILPPEFGEEAEILSMIYLQEEIDRAQRSHQRGSNPDALDVDNMSYEELMQLGERIGYAERPDKPTREMLDRLPSWQFTATAEEKQAEEQECPVCYDCYRDGDELRMLPCFHSFHAQCIDQWLLSDMPGASLCPVCNTRVEL